MIVLFRKLFFIFITYRFKSNKNSLFFDLNFKKIDFTNYYQIKTFIFKLYNYEYINSSSKKIEKKKLDLIIFFHLQRILFEFNSKKITEITSYDIKAYLLSSLIVKFVSSLIPKPR